MHWLAFLVISLAVWRIANMLVNEDGPALIFDKLRHKAGIVRGLDPILGTPITYAENPESVLATVLLCVWCLSVWVGLLFFAVCLVSPSVASVLALPFAFSAVACLIDLWSEKK